VSHFWVGTAIASRAAAAAIGRRWRRRALRVDSSREGLVACRSGAAFQVAGEVLGQGLGGGVAVVGRRGQALGHDRAERVRHERVWRRGSAAAGASRGLDHRVEGAGELQVVGGPEGLLEREQLAEDQPEREQVGPPADPGPEGRVAERLEVLAGPCRGACRRAAPARALAGRVGVVRQV